MSTGATVRPDRHTRTGSTSSPRPAYRPAGAPRTTVRSLSPPGAAPTETARPPAARPTEATCETCARTRRFERRVGQLVRRGLLVGALAVLAAVTAGAPAPQPIPTSPTSAPHATPATVPPNRAAGPSGRAGCLDPFTLLVTCRAPAPQFPSGPALSTG